MRIFALSDLHLATAVNKPMDIFGSRWENHENKIKENWMRLVKPEDVVIVPGDISWGLETADVVQDLALLHSLPGKKLIFKGNHDLWWTSLKKMNAFFESLTFLHNNYYAVGEIAVCGTRGWTLPQNTVGWTQHDEKILQRELMRLETSLKKAAADGYRQMIVAMHYPVTGQQGQRTLFTDIIEKYPVTDVLYGHLHGDEAEKSAFRGLRNGILYHFVSADCCGFSPVLLYQDGVRADEQ